MSDKQMTVRRTSQGGRRLRPVMLAIAGDSGTGKTAVTAGLVKALGPERITSVGADDYHRYDRGNARGCRSPRSARSATTSRSWSSTSRSSLPGSPS